MNEDQIRLLIDALTTGSEQSRAFARQYAPPAILAEAERRIAGGGGAPAAPAAPTTSAAPPSDGWTYEPDGNGRSRVINGIRIVETKTKNDDGDDVWKQVSATSLPTPSQQEAPSQAATGVRQSQIPSWAEEVPGSNGGQYRGVNPVTKKTEEYRVSSYDRDGKPLYKNEVVTSGSTAATDNKILPGSAFAEIFGTTTSPIGVDSVASAAETAAPPPVAGAPSMGGLKSFDRTQALEAAGTKGLQTGETLGVAQPMFTGLTDQANNPQKLALSSGGYYQGGGMQIQPGLQDSPEALTRNPMFQGYVPGSPDAGPRSVGFGFNPQSIIQAAGLDPRNTQLDATTAMNIMASRQQAADSGGALTFTDLPALQQREANGMAPKGSYKAALAAMAKEMGTPFSSLDLLTMPDPEQMEDNSLPMGFAHGGRYVAGAPGPLALAEGGTVYTNTDDDMMGMYNALNHGMRPTVDEDNYVNGWYYDVFSNSYYQRPLDKNTGEGSTLFKPDVQLDPSQVFDRRTGAMPPPFDPFAVKPQPSPHPTPVAYAEGTSDGPYTESPVGLVDLNTGELQAVAGEAGPERIDITPLSDNTTPPSSINTNLYSGPVSNPQDMPATAMTDNPTGRISLQDERQALQRSSDYEPQRYRQIQTALGNAYTVDTYTGKAMPFFMGSQGEPAVNDEYMRWVQTHLNDPLANLPARMLPSHFLRSPEEQQLIAMYNYFKRGGKIDSSYYNDPGLPPGFWGPLNSDRNPAVLGFAEGGSYGAGMPGSSGWPGSADGNTFERLFTFNSIPNETWSAVKAGWNWLTPAGQMKAWSYHDLPGNGSPWDPEGNSFIPGYSAVTADVQNPGWRAPFDPATAEQLELDTHRQYGNVLNPSTPQTTPGYYVNDELQTSRARLMHTPVRKVETRGPGMPTGMAGGGSSLAGMPAMPSPTQARLDSLIAVGTNPLLASEMVRGEVAKGLLSK